MRDCSHVISPFKWALEQVRDYSSSFGVGTPTKRGADALVLFWGADGPFKLIWFVFRDILQ